MRALSLTIAATAALAACKDKPGGPEPASPPSAGESAAEATASGAEPASPPEQKAPAGGEGSCDVTIAGAVSLKDQTNDVVLGTTHWMTAEEVESTGSQGLLVLNCRATRVQLIVSEPPDSRASDVPFGPKKYPVGDKPGALRIAAVIGNDSYEATSGALEVTRWDDDGFAASFSADASKAGSADPIKLTGSVTVPCMFGFGKCKRGQ